VRLNAVIEIIPLKISEDVNPGDKIDKIIVDCIASSKKNLQNGDIIVIAQKIVSKAEGQIICLSSIKPSDYAVQLAHTHKKDPRLVELITRESRSILRLSEGVIISETKHGFVCANAGIDQSNIKNSQHNALLLPEDPDKSANEILNSLKEKTKKNVAVIIVDSFGRPFRNGQTNVAIGIAGIEPIASYIGKEDMYGKKLRVTEIAVVDELASAAELIMGKTNRIPVVIIRGFNYTKGINPSISKLIRPKEKDLFR
jgi:coenzyme F420-0:L-glutamate ligase / coenzyme F420-1:gamma-L-glutamate ligase